MYLLPQVVRLLANLSVNEEVGRAMASDKTIVDELMTILSRTGRREKEGRYYYISCSPLAGSLPLTHYCELTINTLATLNNLSFHALQSSYLLHTQQHISRCEHFVYSSSDITALLCVQY